MYPLRNLSQLEQIQLMGPNLPKNMSDKSLGKENIKIVITI